MNYVTAPFTVIVDTREQSPWGFTGFTADARHWKNGIKPPLIIPIKSIGLPTGDYSLEGYESRIACERKSKQDAYQTFCHGRDRFERELERMMELEFAAVIVEASWPALLGDPPPHTKFSPKSFYRSVIAWQVRFPRIQWWLCETRGFAERTALRLLERFYLDDQERKKKAAG